jgi:Flp pilus assembly protein TadD
LQSGKYDDALAVLHKANKIQETNIANRLIGEILLKKNDRNALGYLKKAYYKFSSNPNFLNTLCYVCIYNDDLEYAEKIPGELKQLSPDSERIRNYMIIIAQKRKAGKVK